MKKFLTFLAFIAFFSLSSPAALASGGIEVTVQQLIEDRSLSERRLAIGYYNIDTGEYYFYNENAMFQSASLYKLPMCMYYAEEIALGNIDPDAKILGMSFELVCRQSIQYSSNDTAHALRAHLGGFRKMRELYAKYLADTPDELPENYLSDSLFSAAQCIKILQKLYDNGEIFSDIIQYMEDATPGRFFESGALAEKTEIAQKYGYLDDGHLNNMAIIYADSPFLLVVLTKNAPNSPKLLGEIADLFISYTNEDFEARMQAQAEKIASALSAKLNFSKNIDRETPDPELFSGRTKALTPAGS